MAMPILAYLKRELGFTSQEWIALDAADKETLKEWAREEMEVLGV